jgi:hypothetical protein
MASAQKKVILRRFTGVLASGYLPQSGLLDGTDIPFMAVDGKLIPLPVNDIKTIAYVRDFNLDNPVDPEQILRKSFAARPRGDGLWLKLTFLDDDTLEGLTPFSLALADALIDDRGLFLTPPDTRGNTQRLFIPRAAIRSLEVLGYVTAPSRRKLNPSPAGPAQPNLFPYDPE